MRKKVRFRVECIAEFTVEDSTEGMTNATIVMTGVSLGVPVGLDKHKYVNHDGSLTEAGNHTVTIVLASALGGHILSAESDGYMNRVPHSDEAIQLIGDTISCEGEKVIKTIKRHAPPSPPSEN